MTTISIQAPPCPPWCEGGHLTLDDGAVMHVSAEQIVAATCGPERAELYVSLERVDVPGQSTGVRLEGSRSAPMTPLEAIQLGVALQVAATAALLDETAAAR